MAHEIDWMDNHGLLAVELQFGTRTAQTMPYTGPMIWELMEAIGQFQLKVIENEMLPRGWGMRPHSRIIAAIKATITFIDHSHQSGKYISQSRVPGTNVFVWRVVDCGLAEKELLNAGAREHARRSIPHRTRPKSQIPATVETIGGAGETTSAQSVELGFGAAITKL